MANKLSSDQVSENFCIATDMLIEKQLKKLQFDKTIDAIVINATRASEGIYTVSYGASNFIAYSQDASYKENDTVMVTVPQGNFDNQKMIIGKKVVENENGEISSLIKYESPFSKFIDLTGNLVNNIEISNIIGITANADNYYLNNGIENYTEESSNKFTTISISETKFKYKTIGVRAKFQTLLNQYNLISGNYGLILKLNYKKENDSDNLNKFIIFDSSSFFGNIYNFIFYQSQEEVFDLPILEGYKLDTINIYPYQQKNFINQQESLISAENNSNIFIKDIEIYLGISSQGFENDSIALECLDQNLMYDKNSNPKKVVLNWIHRDKNNDIFLVNKDNLPTGYTVQWYRKKIGNQAPDTFMNQHWERFYGQNENYENNDENNDSLTNCFEINFKPTYEKEDKEQLCVVVLKDNFLYLKTTILTFENINKIQDTQQFIYDANALSIKCDDDSNDDRRGNYFCYDKTGQILESVKTTRTLTAVFDNTGNNFNIYTKNNLLGHSSIKWIFPDDNTMIEPIQDDEYYTKDENSNIFIGKENSNQYPISIQYKIKEKLNYSANNNTIYLEVEKDGTKFIASISIQFGTFGTSGSEYTIIINWENGSPVFEYNNDNDYSLNGKIVLLGPNGNEVTLNENTYYNWDWYKQKKSGLILYDYRNSNNEERKIYQSQNKEYEFKIKKNNSFSLDDFYILEISLQNFGDYSLTARFPIACKFQDNNNFIIQNLKGPTIIRYASDGVINFNKIPYELNFKNNSGNEKINCIWKIYPDIDNINIPSLVSLEDDEDIKIKEENIDSKILEEILINLRYEEEKDLVVNFNGNDYHYIELIDNDDSHGVLRDILMNFQEGYETLELYENRQKRQNNDFKASLFADEDFFPGSFQQNENQQNTKVYLNIEFFTRDLFTQSSYLKNFYIEIFKNKFSDLFNSFFQKYSEKNFNYKWTIAPPKIYFQDIPLCGIQCIVKDQFNDIQGTKVFGSGQIIWSQPLYIYKDNYPSTTLNQWSGKEIIFDNNTGTILSNGFSAGKKNEDNSFTGIILGDWSKTKSDESITVNTGIFGFYQGVMSYAFKDNGTAFIGQDGAGRIELDGTNAIIQSSNYQENQSGSKFDLYNGQLFLFGNNSLGVDNYSLVLNSFPLKKTDILFQVGREKNLGKITDNLIENLINSYENAVKNFITCYKDYKESFLLLQKFPNFEESNNTEILFETYIKENDSINSIIEKENYIIPNLMVDLNFIVNNIDNKYYYLDNNNNNNNNIEYNTIFSSEVPVKLNDGIINDQGLKYGFKNNYYKEYITRASFYKCINEYFQFLIDKNLETNEKELLKEEYSLEEEDFINNKIYSENCNNLDSREQPLTPSEKKEPYFIYTYKGETTSYYGFFQKKRTIKGEIIFYSDIIFTKQIEDLRFHDKTYAKTGCILQLNKEKINSLLSYKQYTIKYYQNSLTGDIKPPIYVIISRYSFDISSSKIPKGIFKIKKYLDNKYLKIFSMLEVKENKFLINENLLSLINNIKDSINEIKKNKKDDSEENFLDSYIENKESQYLNTFDYYYYNDNNNGYQLKEDFNNIIIKLLKQEFNQVSLNEYLEDNICIESDFVFKLTSWENNLIKLTPDGGYLTSKNYRPTVGNNSKTRTPLDDQWISNFNSSSQGMKGFIIDLTHDKIILGNNSSIEGYQTQSYQGQAAKYRKFKISTGVNFKGEDAFGRDLLQDNYELSDTYFIKAEVARENIFSVTWNGEVTINKLVLNGQSYKIKIGQNGYLQVE